MAPVIVDSIGLELVIAGDSPPGTTELDVVYDGTAPPFALFDALSQAGWERPVAAPPPRSAIDWSEPDAARGTRYSLRSFRAVSRVHPGPAGSPAQLVRATLVLAQAYGAVTPELGPEVVHAPVEQPAALPLVSGPCATVRIVIAATRVERLVALLAGSVEVIARQPSVIVKTNTYRGHDCQTEAAGVELTLLVDVDQLDEVTATLQREAGSTPLVQHGD